MRKKNLYITLLLVVGLVSSCSKPAKKPIRISEFVDEVRLKTTPVKDQGQSELCWMYAMLGTIETEHLMLGDSVNLSEDYLARMYLEEQGRRSYLSECRTPISLRGMASMTLHLLQTYGIEPYDSYHAKNAVNYRVLSRRLQQMSLSVRNLDEYNEEMDKLLDEQIDFKPRIVFMLGAQYTPLEFAHSVCREGEYVSLTSFSHHPFGESFVLETPDNAMHDDFENVKIDDLMAYIENALQAGHPVCWEGDISEEGFSFEKGTALLEDDGQKIDQERRQIEFERRQTTDDHTMELVGIAHDRQGNKYFIAKNSWGVDNPYDGFMYLSFNYVKLKTIAVFMSRDAMNGKRIQESGF